MNTSSILKNQHGAALIISLVILIAMTLIAVTSMKGTSTELSMAGNLRESGLTFQAAEAGLRSGEAEIQSSSSSSTITGGTIAETTVDPDYLMASTWTGAQEAGLDL